MHAKHIYIYIKKQLSFNIDSTFALTVLRMRISQHSFGQKYIARTSDIFGHSNTADIYFN